MIVKVEMVHLLPIVYIEERIINSECRNYIHFCFNSDQ